MNTVFTVVKYEEKVANRITTKYFENKNIRFDTVKTVEAWEDILAEEAEEA